MELHTEREHAAMGDLLESHVEACLRRLWRADAVTADGDGDYGYRWGTAMCWVRPRRDDLEVEVFAYAALGVKSTAKCLAEVNELNRRSRHAKVYLDGGSVTVSLRITWDAVDTATLDHAMRHVGSVADDVGALVAAVFGGRTPSPVEEDEPVGESGAEGEAA